MDTYRKKEHYQASFPKINLSEISKASVDASNLLVEMLQNMPHKTQIERNQHGNS